MMKHVSECSALVLLDCAKAIQVAFDTSTGVRFHSLNNTVQQISMGAIVYGQINDPFVTGGRMDGLRRCTPSPLPL